MKGLSSRLKHRMELQEEVLASDDGGGFTCSWNTVATLWGEILPISGGDLRQVSTVGREFFVAGQVQAQLSHRIYLRWRGNITPAMRLVFDERAFNIRYVAAVREEKEMLELMVQEGVAD